MNRYLSDLRGTLRWPSHVWVTHRLFLGKYLIPCESDSVREKFKGTRLTWMFILWSKVQSCMKGTKISKFWRHVGVHYCRRQWGDKSKMKIKMKFIGRWNCSQKKVEMKGEIENFRIEITNGLFRSIKIKKSKEKNQWNFKRNF